MRWIKSQAPNRTIWTPKHQSPWPKIHHTPNIIQMLQKASNICTKWASKLENSYQIRNACNDFEIFCISFSCHECSTCKKSSPEWCKCYVNKNAPIQCQKCDTNCHTFLYVSKMRITCEKKSKPVTKNSYYVWMPSMQKMGSNGSKMRISQHIECNRSIFHNLDSKIPK